MRIVLDAMGSDACPHPEVDGAIQAIETFGDEIILVGNDAQVRPLLEARGNPSKIRLIHAEETITMEDKGLKLALKAKRKNSHTSMAIGMDLVKNGEADAFVTAGNTGGALTTAYFRLGVMDGVERPGLTAMVPTKDGFCVVLDIGANPDCKPEHLLQFGIMGSVYAEKALGVARPKVGLLSNGEEAGKGNELVKAAFPLLQASTLNFFGNIEGKELFGGDVDVAITDGFTGNVLIKASEAVAKLLVDVLKEGMLSSTRTKIGAVLAKPAFTALKGMLDPDEIGAAPLLGLNGLVFVGHGRSNAKAIFSAIKAARSAVDAQLVEAMGSAIQEQLQQIS
ncbi:MAG: phosphate acyltransferase PlsX [Chloroflexi bacterium]|jgi:phosphate acyltransferase|nr:phosphate acyltransferase PlsX [Chloroflexota bacterium]